MNNVTPDGMLDSLPQIPAKVEVSEHHYFPTQIFSFQVPSHLAKLASKLLLDTISSEREKDKKGIQRSNFRNLGGWHSHNDLHHLKAFKPLVDLIHACAASISELNGYHDATILEIGTMWAIVNPPGSFNRSHIHPACLWSGVYYVQTPENCGDVEFTDPRTENLICPPRYRPNKRRQKACWSKVTFTPTAGRMLIFPNWLYHAVTPNMSTAHGAEADRVIVSFNLLQSKLSDKPDV